MSICGLDAEEPTHLRAFVFNGYLRVMVRVFLCEECFESFLDTEGEH